MKLILYFLLFILLNSCTTQRVLININKDGLTEKFYSNSDIVCPKFVLPTLNDIPAIPTEIQIKKEMTDDEIIYSLTEYASKLRKTMIENQTNINKSYKQYLDSCKN